MAMSISGVALTVCSVAVGLILCGSVLAPIAQSVMDDFTATEGGVPIYENGASWASLVGVTVLLSIVGLVIVAVNGYTGGKK